MPRTKSKRVSAPPEIRRLLHNAVDLHIHSAPSHYPRNVNDIEAAGTAASAGMKAIVIKNHRESTVGRAKIVSEIHKDIQVFGGIVLNHQFGINPIAVRMALDLGGKIVWMPTIDAWNYLRNPTIEMFRPYLITNKPGLRVLDEEGHLLIEVEEILRLIAKADAILATGHLSIEEQKVLIQKAREIGVRKILVQHPTIEFLNFSLDDMKELVNMGAFLEHDYVVRTPLVKSPVGAGELAKMIAETDPKHCVLATDGGAKMNPTPFGMISKFVDELNENGMDRREIATMVSDNPGRLLGLA